MLRTLRARFFTDEDEAVATRSYTEPPSLATAASVVALGFLGSRLLGLVRTVAIAHQFGTSPDLDAYFVAFRLPDLIFQLAGGRDAGQRLHPDVRARAEREGRASSLAALVGGIESRLRRDAGRSR